ncbi:hypothetical protein GCM10027440_12320 [Nocardiopsis coralliicola]
MTIPQPNHRPIFTLRRGISGQTGHQSPRESECPTWGPTRKSAARSFSWSGEVTLVSNRSKRPNRRRDSRLFADLGAEKVHARKSDTATLRDPKFVQVSVK